MTWVFGTATDFFGTAICVADVQVTFGDGETIDCLQKIYPIARNVVAGFAGDVQLGFIMLARLSRLMREGASGSARGTLEEFSRIARDCFAQAPAASRESGSELLLAYVLPDTQTLYGGRPVVASLRDPDFELEEV